MIGFFIISPGCVATDGKPERCVANAKQMRLLQQFPFDYNTARPIFSGDGIVRIGFIFLYSINVANKQELLADSRSDNFFQFCIAFKKIV